MLIAESLCLHCGTASSRGSFCCDGCQSVYELLQNKGLAHFYELKKSYPMGKVPPVEELSSQKSHVEIDSNIAQFYLKGIHCLGCLWLLEKLPEIDSRIQSASLDFVHQILEVKIQKTITWDEVTALIHKLGYQPKLIIPNTATPTDHREQLAKIGVAGFCAGNIMLLSVSIYGGADSQWSFKFAWMSFLLILPVMFYSAWPIFRAAFKPLLKGRISVDLAISLALVAGMLMSSWSLIFGNAKEIYFDSLSMLVFLLLSSRYFLSRLRESIAKETPYLSFLQKESYARLEPNASIVSANEIKKNDLFLLKKGQTVPTDALTITSCHFDLSLITGESNPVHFYPGKLVESGAKLLTQETKLKSVSEASNSRLAKILDQMKIFQISRSETLDFSERMGKYFVLAVLAIAAITLGLMPNTDGFQRALALVIVTCPCVLALAVPLSFTRAIQVAARKGILFKHPEKLEALAEARNIFLDKTGTLTTGSFKILRWINVKGDPEQNKKIIFSLEKFSSHPIAGAILDYLGATDSVELTHVKEIIGRGVEGTLGNDIWEIRANRSLANQISLFKNDIAHVNILIGDSLRKESRSCVEQLNTFGLSTHLISGDSEENTMMIANQIKLNSFQSNLSPEKKAQIVKNVPYSIMVGDGANDGVAFQAASVGIAVQGAVDISLKNADISFTKPGLENLIFVIQLAKKTRQLIRINFSFTLFYNLIAGTLALMGFMSPLIAAILMPTSALTVFLFTQWQTAKEHK